MTGFLTLLYKELLRFWKVGFQNSIRADGVHPALPHDFFACAGRACGGFPRRGLYGFPDSRPGDDGDVAERFCQLVIQPDPVKDHWQSGFCAVVAAFLPGNIFRLRPGVGRTGACVGLGVYLVTVCFFECALSLFRVGISICLDGHALLGAIGIVAGYLGRQIRSARSLPEFCHSAADFFIRRVLFDSFIAAFLAEPLSHLNPFFYMIDGFSYGFFNVSDISPYISLGIVAACFVAVSWLTLWMLKRGYKIRH